MNTPPSARAMPPTQTIQREVMLRSVILRGGGFGAAAARGGAAASGGGGGGAAAVSGGRTGCAGTCSTGTGVGTGAGMGGGAAAGCGAMPDCLSSAISRRSCRISRCSVPVREMAISAITGRPRP